MQEKRRNAEENLTTQGRAQFDAKNARNNAGYVLVISARLKAY
jgi:hypothetical protein